MHEYIYRFFILGGRISTRGYASFFLEYGRWSNKFEDVSDNVR